MTEETKTAPVLPPLEITWTPEMKDSQLARYHALASAALLENQELRAQLAATAQPAQRNDKESDHA